MTREIIEFKRPLLCFAKSISFLGVSAVLTILGDMNVFWLLLFLSFFGPSMLKSRDSSQQAPDTNRSDDKEREHTASGLMLTKRGAVVVAKFTALFEKLDSKIPKFSDWQEQQKIKKSKI